jgi:hypothetical protein
VSASEERLWDEWGTTLRKHDDCHVCGEDEVGSHFERAWCHRCGWRGTLAEHRAAAAMATRTDEDDDE